MVPRNASCGTIVHEGRPRRLSLFVLVLGYSRTIWARFVVSERRPVMLDLLEQGFQELGGVPRELLIDNLKQAVEVVTNIYHLTRGSIEAIGRSAKRQHGELPSGLEMRNYAVTAAPGRHICPRTETHLMIPGQDPLPSPPHLLPKE